MQELSIRKAAEYMLKSLPGLSGELLTNAEVFDLTVFGTKSFRSLQYFIRRFPSLANAVAEDELEEEFLKLQIEELPKAITEEADAGEQWTMIGNVKDHTGQHKFGQISKLAKYVLLIPHSNACCERVFSHVRKVRTDFRASMGKDSLNAICILKEGLGGPCYEAHFSKKETLRAKGATSTFVK